MSNALEKAAGFSPAEIMLLSTLGGGGMYGGMRLLTELGHKISPPKKQQTKIQLQLRDPYSSNTPTSTEPSEGGTAIPGISKVGGVPPSSEGGHQDVYAPLLAGLAGFPLGFLGVKHMYDAYQGMQGDKEVEDAKKKYQQQLLMAQQMHNKIGEETPCVDNFCEAVASELSKEANFANIISNLGHGLGKRFGQIINHPKTMVGGLALAGSGAAGAGDYMTKTYPWSFGIDKSNIPNVSRRDILQNLPTDQDSIDSANDTVTNRSWRSIAKLFNRMTGGTTGNLADMWMLGAGASGLAGFGMLNHAHNEKKEKEMKAQYPTGIEYANE